MTQQIDITQWPIIKQSIIDNYTSTPRSTQKTIGPSELGTDSLHSLAAKLAGWTPVRPRDIWRAFVGTAIHKMLENAFIRNTEVASHPTTRELIPRYQPELNVTVGQLYDNNIIVPINGRIDLYDVQTQTIIDWKTSGYNVRQKALKHGLSQLYLVQASLYGIGMQAQQFPVTTNCIYYMPVDKGGLKDVVPLCFPFNPTLGIWALQRAQIMLNIMTQIIQESGISMRDAWISKLPESPTFDFCDYTWADDSGAQRYIGSSIVVPDKWMSIIPTLEATFSG